VGADKALRADQSKAALHLLQSSTERRRLDAGNEAREQSLAHKQSAGTDTRLSQSST